MLPLLGLSPVSGKTIVAKFDGGLLSPDGGILVLREVEQRLRVADRMAACLKDPRAPDQITHTLADIIRFRQMMIAAGYEDGSDASGLRRDPMLRDEARDAPEGEAQNVLSGRRCRQVNADHRLDLDDARGDLDEERCCRSVFDRRGVRPRSPNPSLKRVTKYGASGGEKPKAILCASSEEMCGPHQSDQNPHSDE
jgi:Transposase DDE domain group 1